MADYKGGGGGETMKRIINFASEKKNCTVVSKLSNGPTFSSSDNMIKLLRNTKDRTSYDVLGIFARKREKDRGRENEKERKQICLIYTCLLGAS